VVLGAVLLTVTGAEALYADLGHFGRRPIRLAWMLMVFPALIVNYLGQGALILDDPAAVRNPFFLLVPDWSRLAMVGLATAATVIASQAVISGAFSITHQAMRLGFLPRLTVRHTSEREAGQVYVPAVNWVLYAAVALLVAGFGSSTHLASAYGIAVAGTMTITTVLFFFIARTAWGAPAWVAAGGAAAFLTVDLALFSASLAKVGHGGWVPLAIAVAMFTILTTWRRGDELVERSRRAEEGPLGRFVEQVRAAEPPVHRAPGGAAYLHGDRETAPLGLRANVRFNHSLHETVLIVLVESTSTPHVKPAARVLIDDLGYRDDGIMHVTARFGYLDVTDVPRALARARAGLERGADVDEAFYVLSRITIVRTAARGMRPWRKRLFIALWNVQTDPVQFFRLPEQRTVTMGSLIEI
jgi:KUP system potassium uptake protein